MEDVGSSVCSSHSHSCSLYCRLLPFPFAVCFSFSHEQIGPPAHPEILSFSVRTLARSVAPGQSGIFDVGSLVCMCIDTSPTEGFTNRCADCDAYVQKASLAHSVHECAAARKWAGEQGTVRYLWFKKEQRQKEDKNGNMVIRTEWVPEIESWGNYDLTDGDFIHGWDMDRPDLGDHIAPAHGLHWQSAR